MRDLRAYPPDGYVLRVYSDAWNNRTNRFFYGNIVYREYVEHIHYHQWNVVQTVRDQHTDWHNARHYIQHDDNRQPAEARA